MTTSPHPVRMVVRPALIVAAVAALVIAAVTSAPWARAAVPPPPAGFTLTFSDDFSGAANTGLDRSKWLYDIGTGYPGGAPNWGTHEVERMTDSTANVFQDGQGHLAIKPIRDGAGNWTSGRVETQRTDFAAPAGGKLRVEASLQQPNVSGAEAAGYWPAFWMLGAAARPAAATNWPGIGEWDVMEDINGRSSTFGTLHCGVAPGGPCNEFTGRGSGERACGGCQTGFHKYAVEYDRSVSPEQLRWYLDGNNFFTLRSNEVDATAWNNATHHGMFVILNVAIGGDFPAAFGGGPTGATRSGVPMLVDYLAVYTAGGGGNTSPPPSSPPPGGRDAYADIEAESFNAQSGTQTETCADPTGGGQDVGWIANGDWLRYDNVDFGSSAAHTFWGRVASGAGGGVSGVVEVRLDNRSNAPVTSFSVANTGGWQNWTSIPAGMSGVTGKHTVFVTFASGQPNDFVNINRFTFRH